MLSVKPTACLILATLLCSCASTGYYDANGDHRAYGRSTSDYRHRDNLADAPIRPQQSIQGIYTHAGYYDHNGRYMAAMQGGAHIPAQYFPPKGMCRVWFRGQPFDNQPQPEQCADIHGLAPENAYVMYGG